MMNVAYKKYNKKWCISNQMLGNTIFASKYPQLKNPKSGSYLMLPRPHETFSPKGIGQLFMKNIGCNIYFLILMYFVGYMCTIW